MSWSVSSDLIAYVGGLELVGGDHDGQRFEVLPWERRFLAGAFRATGDAALTVARGNGKSALVAAVACAVVDPAGPMHGRRREVVCCAASFEQGRIIFEDVLAFLSGPCTGRSCAARPGRWRPVSCRRRGGGGLRPATGWRSACR